MKSPLKEGLLKYNCGVPIVFVINKSDTEVEYVEKKDLEENSEFILSHIRRLALEYGATIIYTSGKTNINLTVLYDYICHVLFNFELAHKPNFIEKEAYFIPAGYDDLKTLNSNEEIKRYLEEPFDHRIRQEIRENPIIEEDIQCEDTNAFFEDLKRRGIKNKEKDFKKLMTKVEKDKKYEEKRKDVKEMIAKKFIHHTSDIKETKVGKETKKDTNRDEDKKNKTRENMLLKLKGFTKKK